MALSSEVVSLIRLHLLNDAYQIGADGEVAVLENQVGITLVGVLEEVIGTDGVERGGASFDAVQLVALLQEELRLGIQLLRMDLADV